MDKVTAGLLGAVAGLATMGVAQAAPPAANPAPTAAASYADLLAPIANPVELLKADNAARTQAQTDGVQLAEWYGDREYGQNYHHHHHHHHHRYYGRNEHHHHHHHHNSSWVGVPGVGGVVIRRD